MALAEAPNPGRLLDAPPPGPPGTPRRASLMETQMQARSARPGGGMSGPMSGPMGGPGGPGMGPMLGMEGGDPHIGVSRGLAKVQEGLQEIGAWIPGLAPAFSNLVPMLHQAAIQGLADQYAGTDTPGAAAIGATGAEIPVPPGAMSAGMMGRGPGPAGGAPPPGPPPPPGAPAGI